MRLVQSYIYMLLIASCGLVGLTESSKKTDALSPMCPTDCRCLTTTEGLHKAICYNLQSLYKYTHLNKHHNVNIIDLSYSNITKINEELDSFTEIVTLDLSHNNIRTINKFLPNSKKLVHLNLRNNELRTLSASTIPSSVSSLDLQFNSLRDVPTELTLLRDLEHLQLEGNPLHCSCANIKILNALRHNGVVLDHIKCATPLKWKNAVWSELKLNQLCSYHGNKELKSNDEVMFADGPTGDSETFGDLSTDKKLMDMSAVNDLSAGEVFEAKHPDDGDDDTEFLPLSTEKPKNSPEDVYEGSGYSDVAVATADDPLNNTEVEGSGDDGSGDLPLLNQRLQIQSSTPEPDDEYDDDSGSGNEIFKEETTTTEKLFITGLFNSHFNEHDDGIEDNNNSSTSQIETPESPSIFGEKIDWNEADPVDPVEENINVGRKMSPNENTPNSNVVTEDKEPNVVKIDEHKTEDVGIDNSEDAINGEIKEAKSEASTPAGTYICIGLIIALLLGLIILSLVKGRIRKHKNQRLSRQQPKDVEKAGKEMIDMNKSLLGKPALATIDSDKKMNGNYEMVPTHETCKNGKADKSPETLQVPTRAETQNSAPPTNGIALAADRASPAESLEPPIPLTPLRMTPEHNHNGYSDHDSMPYHDDHSPPSGIVKIKLSETQKPKTPVLVTRSRSNAGDIIITPVADQTLPFKPTT